MFKDKNEGSKSEKKLEDEAANNGLTPRVSFFSGQLIKIGDATISSREEVSINGSLNLVNSRLEADQAFLEGNLNLKNSELVIRGKRDRVTSIEETNRPKAHDIGITHSGKYEVTGKVDISSRPDQESLDGCLTLENATLVIDPDKTTIIGSNKIKHHRVAQDQSLMDSVYTSVERYTEHRPVYTPEFSNIQNNTPANGVVSGFGYVRLESEEGDVILNVDPEEVDAEENNNFRLK